MHKRFSATISGRVQGVSFRYYTHREANRLGVTGWVANRRDRTVRVVAEGEEAQLHALVDWLQQGSPAAQVRSVDVTWQAATGEFPRFEVRLL